MLRRGGDSAVVGRVVETAVAKGMERLEAVEQLPAQAQETVPSVTRANVDEALQAIVVPSTDLSRYDVLVGGVTS